MQTKAELIRYIRSQLGEPTIQVEVTDQQMSEVIDDAIKKYTDVVFGDFEDQMQVRSTDFDQYGRLQLPCMSNILHVLSIDGRLKYNFHWNNINRILTLKEIEAPPKLLIIGMTSFKAQEVDYIYNEQWVRDFAKAKTLKLWGQILGKYTQNLVGGATLNYDRMISEGESEMEALMEELYDKWVDPAPIIVC